MAKESHCGTGSGDRNGARESHGDRLKGKANEKMDVLQLLQAMVLR